MSFVKIRPFWIDLLSVSDTNQDSMNYVSIIFLLSLTTESHYNANFFVTGSTGGCHNDNLQCHQWTSVQD